MTKELELFKKWFGWDPQGEIIIPGGIEEYKTKKLMVPFIKIEFGLDEDHNNPGPTAYIYYHRLLGKEDTFYVINRDSYKEMYSNGCIVILHAIPSEYHAEWEQYVKEKKE